MINEYMSQSAKATGDLRSMNYTIFICSFKSLFSWISYNIASGFVCACVYFVEFYGAGGDKTYGILVPWPGTEPTPPALEGKVNHSTTREVPVCCLWCNKQNPTRDNLCQWLILVIELLSIANKYTAQNI